MQETLEQLQQEAYIKGQQLKQWHLQQHRVIDSVALAVLASDFAQLSIFKSYQYPHPTEAHERAGLCARAFQEGYIGQDDPQ